MLACCAAAFVLFTPAPLRAAGGEGVPPRASHRIEVVVPRIVSTRMIDRGDGVLRPELRTNDPALRAWAGPDGVAEQWTTRAPDGQVVTIIRQTFVAP